MTAHKFRKERPRERQRERERERERERKSVGNCFFIVKELNIL